MYKACKIAGNQMKPMVMLVKPGRVFFLFFASASSRPVRPAMPKRSVKTPRILGGNRLYLQQQIQLINKSLPAPLTRKTARGGSKRA